MLNKQIWISQLLVVLFIAFGSIQLIAQTPSALDGQKQNTVRVKITGMTCAGCANHVYKVLSKTDGVLDNSVEYHGDIAVVKYNPEMTNPADIIAAIEEETTYKAELFTPKGKNKK